MTYQQQLEARKTGQYILTSRNFKFIMCGTEEQVNKKYKRGNHIAPPLIEKIVSSSDIRAMELSIENKRMNGLLI